MTTTCLFHAKCKSIIKLTYRIAAHCPLRTAFTMNVQPFRWLTQGKMKLHMSLSIRRMLTRWLSSSPRTHCYLPLQRAFTFSTEKYYLLFSRNYYQKKNCLELPPHNYDLQNVTIYIDSAKRSECLASIVPEENRARADIHVSTRLMWLLFYYYYHFFSFHERELSY